MRKFHEGTGDGYKEDSYTGGGYGDGLGYGYGVCGDGRADGYKYNEYPEDVRDALMAAQRSYPAQLIQYWT